MMRFIGTVIVAMAGLSTTAVAGKYLSGRAIVEQGSGEGAPACISCHGSNLQGNDAAKIPPLAGKPVAYIIARLDHYGSPQGHNAMMKQVANSLSNSERKAVAGYIAHLPPPPSK